MPATASPAASWASPVRWRITRSNREASGVASAPRERGCVSAPRDALGALTQPRSPGRSLDDFIRPLAVDAQIDQLPLAINRFHPPHETGHRGQAALGEFQPRRLALQQLNLHALGRITQEPPRNIAADQTVGRRRDLEIAEGIRIARLAGLGGLDDVVRLARRHVMQAERRAVPLPLHRREQRLIRRAEKTGPVLHAVRLELEEDPFGPPVYVNVRR